MKKTLKTFFIIAFVVIIAYITITLFISGGFTLFSENPPKPEIKYSEFPFLLEYEINGEKFAIKDTLICEFDGFATNEARGKYRKWKSHMASGKDRITLLLNDDIEIFFSPGLNDWAIAATYMGDTEIYNSELQSTFPSAYYKKDYNDKNEGIYGISAEEMWNKYKLKLLKWETSTPIKNNFK